MHAALHARNSDAVHFSDHQPALVSNGRGLRKMWNLRVGNLCGLSKIIRERSEPRPQYQRNLRPQRRARENKLRRGFSAFEFAGSLRTRRLHIFRRCNLPRRGSTLAPNFFSALGHVRIPTMDADIRFAMVPASIARMPSFARLPRCSGASAPIPPI